MSESGVSTPSAGNKIMPCARDTVQHSAHTTNHPPAMTSNKYHDYANEKIGEATLRAEQPLDSTIVRQVFPLKLHYMLSDVEADGLAHIVSWRPHGRCFAVHNPKVFVEKMLPLWFQQSKFASFQRQLNLYCFKRITAGPDKGCYYHELFLRGKHSLCFSIKRMKLKGSGARKKRLPEEWPNFLEAAPLPSTTPVAEWTGRITTRSSLVDDHPVLEHSQFPTPHHLSPVHEREEGGDKINRNHHGSFLDSSHSSLPTVSHSQMVTGVASDFVVGPTALASTVAQQWRMNSLERRPATFASTGLQQNHGYLDARMNGLEHNNNNFRQEQQQQHESFISQQPFVGTDFPQAVDAERLPPVYCLVVLPTYQLRFAR